MGKMCRAIRCHGYGPIDQLKLDEIPVPTPRADGILIRIKMAGVNFPDGLLVQGLYQAKPQTPFVPGMEVVGEVVEVGDNVKRLKLGQTVGAICTYGGFSEYVCVPETSAFEVPAELDGAKATALMCGYGTAWHALKQRAQLKAGETLLVTGAAGLTGLAAVQLGKAVGATVIGVASSKEKRALVLANGADHVIAPEALRDEVKSITGGKGIDVAFEVVGGEVFDQCTRIMSWGGRLLIVGFASGTIGKVPANLPLVKGYGVLGVFWGDFVRREPEQQILNMKDLIGFLQEAKIDPHVGGEFALEDAVGALEHIMGRKAHGKIVLNCS